jgi:hypothetical protein
VAVGRVPGGRPEERADIGADAELIQDLDVLVVHGSLVQAAQVRRDEIDDGRAPALQELDRGEAKRRQRALADQRPGGRQILVEPAAAELAVAGVLEEPLGQRLRGEMRVETHQTGDDDAASSVDLTVDAHRRARSGRSPPDGDDPVVLHDDESVGQQPMLSAVPGDDPLGSADQKTHRGLSCQSRVRSVNGGEKVRAETAMSSTRVTGA